MEKKKVFKGCGFKIKQYGIREHVSMLSPPPPPPPALPYSLFLSYEFSWLSIRESQIKKMEKVSLRT